MSFKQSVLAISLSVVASVSFAAVKTTLVSCFSTHGSNTSCQYKATGVPGSSKPVYLYAQTAMPYALCSKALCQPDHGAPNMVTCTCPIYQSGWKGVSVGPKPYSVSKPTALGKQLTSVTSNFSMANLKSTGQKPTTCTGNKKLPWANCFGIRCGVVTVNGRQMASCQCPVAYSKSFISVGPKNTAACNKGKMVWSGALASQGQSNGIIIPAMYKKYFGK